MITAELARQIWNYNPDTGEFSLKEKRGRGVAGAPITTEFKSGYRILKHRGRQYYAHRVAWLMVFGDWPVNEIDHINGVRNDNRLINLRDVTAQFNLFKSKLSTKKSKRSGASSKYIGVSKHKKGYWVATTRSDMRSKYLGIRSTEADAHKLVVSYYLDNGEINPCGKCDVCMENFSSHP